ncbi:response regulator [filamentous cyanobacterium LEGE 11480]|uniref:histidine kinase n=1 Tax=Romeriopsis navalis LEGE 11480 TaxID=2777977 RepID=A0A928Z6I0_9CYAN|nr:response regulator [Romeriopsis navalis]MBE9032658.1 response regulator [Romeriopsis navalis LEGE 11480]
MQPEQQQRIMGYFIEEAKDHLNTIERGLLNLQSTIEDSEMVNEVFRAAHSVKGGAAMLGLNAIQHTSHRLEDYFKILKETTGIRVDQRLESLLLRVFDTLQELLEQLQGPFGLTEEASNAAMTGIEPVFGEIDAYLGTLSNDVVMPDSVPTVVGIARPLFNENVSADLRVLLDLFKQADSLSDARSQLLGIADRIKGHGESEGLLKWTDLLDQVKAAIANPDNAYRTLAAVVIKDLKQAQDWIKLDQPDSIVASEQLLALLPLAAEAGLPDVAAGSLDADLADLDLAGADLSDLDADLGDFGADLDLTGDADLGDLNLDSLEADFATEPVAGDDLDANLDDLLGDTAATGEFDLGNDLDGLLGDDAATNVDLDGDLDSLLSDASSESAGDTDLNSLFGDSSSPVENADFALDDDLGLDLLDQVGESDVASGDVDSDLEIELDEESTASLENLGELFMGVDESELTLVQDFDSTSIVDLPGGDIDAADGPDLITQALDLNDLNLDDSADMAATTESDMADMAGLSDADLGLDALSLDDAPDAAVDESSGNDFLSGLAMPAAGAAAAGAAALGLTALGDDGGDDAPSERSSGDMGLDSLELGESDLAAIDDLGLETTDGTVAVDLAAELPEQSFASDDFTDPSHDSGELDFGDLEVDSLDPVALNDVADDLGDGMTELQLLDEPAADETSLDALNLTQDTELGDLAALQENAEGDLGDLDLGDLGSGLEAESADLGDFDLGDAGAVAEANVAAYPLAGDLDLGSLDFGEAADDVADLNLDDLSSIDTADGMDLVGELSEPEAGMENFADRPTASPDTGLGDLNLESSGELSLDDLAGLDGDDVRDMPTGDVALDSLDLGEAAVDDALADLDFSAEDGSLAAVDGSADFDLGDLGADLGEASSAELPLDGLSEIDTNSDFSLDGDVAVDDALADLDVSAEDGSLSAVDGSADFDLGDLGADFGEASSSEPALDDLSGIDATSDVSIDGDASLGADDLGLSDLDGDADFDLGDLDADFGEASSPEPALDDLSGIDANSDFSLDGDADLGDLNVDLSGLDGDSELVDLSGLDEDTDLDFGDLSADLPDTGSLDDLTGSADAASDLMSDGLDMGGIADEGQSAVDLSDLADLSFDDLPSGDDAPGVDFGPVDGDTSINVDGGLDDGLTDLMSDISDTDTGFDLSSLGLAAGAAAGAGALGFAALNQDNAPDANQSTDDNASDQSEVAALDNLDALVDFDATDAGFEGDLDALLDDTDSLDGDLGDLSADDALVQTDFPQLDALLDEPSDDPTVDADLAALAADPEFDDLEKLLLDDKDTTGQSIPAAKGSASKAPAARRSLRSGKGFSDQTMRVSVKHLDNLSNLVGELVVNRNSLEQDQERMRQSLDNLLYQVQQLSDVGQRMQDLYERSLLESSLLASRQNRSELPFPIVNDVQNKPGDETDDGVEYDPLEMDRFTGFHTLSQEMIELIVRVRESASDIEFIVDETDQVTRMFRQVTTQLQEGLTRSRMVPFAQTADRLPRAVRDIAMKVGKQAELVVEGRETLIDKMILEHLYDPMTHLVNNAITHGIEGPELRKHGGKSDVGRITIRAFHQGNQTVISVSDDGAGIDVERVRLKAIEKGLITSAEAQTMSRLDLFDLIFHPGFTTRDQADDFAGRGVGMDVVRTSLTEIRGAVTIDSNPGKGTTFTIRLPLTLSISKALCCISDRARIAFPMDGVEDMLDLPKDRLHTDAEGQLCVPWRDTMLPLRPLTELLAHNRHMGRGNVYGGNQEDDIISVVVLRSAGNYLALQVDQVLGEQEIVIKQLEGPVPKPVGIAGATVLGDGRIMPIADVLELIDLSDGRLRRGSGSMWEQDGDQPVVEAPPAKTDPLVLIVDDSITVRELLSMTFNKVGYRVEQARDGQEAWEKLRAGLPCDIVFCDIEMPRMDGLELLSRVQKDPSLKQVPVAMLTSRGADRHRQMATSLGARGYFTKPYLEEALLDAAARMLKGEVLMGR